MISKNRDVAYAVRCMIPSTVGYFMVFNVGYQENLHGEIIFKNYIMQCQVCIMHKPIRQLSSKANGSKKLAIISLHQKKNKQALVFFKTQPKHRQMKCQIIFFTKPITKIKSIVAYELEQQTQKYYFSVENLSQCRKLFPN